MFTANFGKWLRLQQLAGFKISGAFVPDMGIQENFYVYLLTEVAPESPSGKNSPSGPRLEYQAGRLPQADLVITDNGNITYTFPEINLNSCEQGVTHNKRFRLFEFFYSTNRLQLHPNGISIDITNTEEDGFPKKQGRLGDDYKIKLDKYTEYVLGVRARTASAGFQAYRFWKVATQLSLMQKLVAINVEQRSKPTFQPWPLQFRDQTLNISKTNLECMYVDQSFGALARDALFPLYRGLEIPPEHRASLARYHLGEMGAETLLSAVASPQGDGRSIGPQRVIETTTFIFNSADPSVLNPAIEDSAS